MLIQMLTMYSKQIKISVSSIITLKITLTQIIMLSTNPPIKNLDTF